MPQIILKERTAHLARYNFFTRDVNQYKNKPFSQLYHTKRIFFTEHLLPVTFAL